MANQTRKDRVAYLRTKTGLSLLGAHQELSTALLRVRLLGREFLGQGARGWEVEIASLMERVEALIPEVEG